MSILLLVQSMSEFTQLMSEFTQSMEEEIVPKSNGGWKWFEEKTFKGLRWRGGGNHQK